MTVAPRIDVTTSQLREWELTSAELAEPAISPFDVLFTVPLSSDGGRAPDETWTLTGGQASGTAAVYYADGHSRLRKPFLFADGFGYNQSNLKALFDNFNQGQPGLLDELRSRGLDIVLIGFDVRHTYIQHNADVVIAAIRRAITERAGAEPLIVGGFSMGGIVTRYALAQMEEQRIDHETSTYLSWDSPHNGAWIPLILQQLAYFLETHVQTAQNQAALIRSPAAQQMLWAWVPDAGYSGEVTTGSELRVDFVRKLADLGDFPRLCRLLGVVNGRGDGIGRPLPAGEIAFEGHTPIIGATARFQPDLGTGRQVGDMHTRLEAYHSTTTEVPALDGVPGGTSGSFGEVAGIFGATISEEYRTSAFVPAVSSAAVTFDPVAWDVDPKLNLLDQSPDRFHLDDIAFAADNTRHGTVTDALADWVLDRLS